MVRDGDTGDVACDHYHRFESDVALMKSLGLKAYRFSIAWSRVMPEGRGRVNAAGLGFYQRLVDALLAAGIKPMATLYHWDLPAALDDRGGWLNPDIADWFADYARVVYKALDDRVALWVTLNEPWVVTDGGYLHGVLAPGHRNRFEAPIASHHLLRSHAKAVQAYRAEGRHQIGLVVNIEPKYPASEETHDLAATARAHAYMNRQYLDPVLLGHYPNEMREIYGDAWPEWPATDMQLIREPIDFLGINYYTRSVVQNNAKIWPVRAGVVRQPQATHTETGWEVYPRGLTDTLRLDQATLWRDTAVRHRKRRGVFRSAGRRRRAHRRSAARCVPAQAPRRDRRGDPARRGPARLFRVVAARQPRVVTWLLEAFRHRARELRDAGAHAEGERALLRAGHRRARRRALTIRVGRTGSPRASVKSPANRLHCQRLLSSGSGAPRMATTIMDVARLPVSRWRGPRVPGTASRC